MEQFTRALEGSLWSWQLGYISEATHEENVVDATHSLLAWGSPDVSYQGDDVSVSMDVGDLYLSAHFPVKTDRYDETYVSSEGYAFIENTVEGHLIWEDIPVESDVIERELPDVGQIRRDASKERRDREAEYRRMVL